MHAYIYIYTHVVFTYSQTEPGATRLSARARIPRSERERRCPKFRLADMS